MLTQRLNTLFFSLALFAMGCNESRFLTTNRTAAADAKSEEEKKKDKPEVEHEEEVEEASCLKNQGAKLNILFVFDASGSQQATDPQKIRQKAALSFVKQFYDAEKAKDVELRFNSISFNFTSFAGQNGWVLLTDEASKAKIDSDIMFATETPTGGTIYEGAFSGAIQEYAKPEVSKQQQGDKQRSYVVFMTDGGPTDGGTIMQNPSTADLENYFAAGRAKFMPKVQNLISTHNPIMYAVASGEKLNTITQDPAHEVIFEKVVQDIAAAHPAGKYYRAKKAEDLLGVWDNIFKEISNSCQE